MCSSSDMEVVLESWEVLPGSEISFLGSTIKTRANFLTFMTQGKLFDLPLFQCGIWK